MDTIRTFFNKKTLLSVLVMALAISVLFTWKYTTVRNIPFGKGAILIYSTFVAADYAALLFVFFVFHYLSNRQQNS